MQAWSANQELTWLIFCCLLGAATGRRKGGLLGLLFIIIISLSLQLVTDYVSFNHGWWLPVIAPVSGWATALALSVLYFSSQERAERGQLMQMFASHVSKEVAGRLWRDREQFFTEGGVRPDTLTATVLFTDLANFTTIAENMEPLVLMKWLNEYMDVMSNCVIDEGGIVNKYIGDAIMAVFGVPIKSETAEEITEDALRAVRCGLKFNEKLKVLNAQWQQQGLPTVMMRTGIYTGSLVAGSFGGSVRMEYTVIGDTVNTAARLESYDKTVAEPTLDYPCRILIGESTKNLIEHCFQTEMVGKCQLKGKNNFLRIYRLIMT